MLYVKSVFLFFKTNTAACPEVYMPPNALRCLCCFVYKQEPARFISLTAPFLRLSFYLQCFGAAGGSPFCPAYLLHRVFLPGIITLVQVRLIPQIELCALSFLERFFVKDLAPCYVFYRHAAYRVKYDLVVALAARKSASEDTSDIFHS